MNVRQNVSLKDLTSFHIGGPAKYFVEVATKDELLQAAKFAKDQNIKIFVLGEGSNVLISDSGFDGLVIKLNNKNVVFEPQGDSTLVVAEAGLNWGQFVTQAIQKGLQGIECLSGIPGSVGAAPVQNIGAFGQEIKNTIVEVEVFDISKNIFTKLTADQCEFGYRDSLFKKSDMEGRYIVWAITLLLKNTATPIVSYESLGKYLIQHDISNPNIVQIRDAVLDLRAQNHLDPKTSGNAGSFFKNPIVTQEEFKQLQTKFPSIAHYPSEDGTVKIFAAWLIEAAGWKGQTHKNASVSPKHALILINTQNTATAADVSELAQKISVSVEEKFGIKLIREVKYVNV
ncbi:MAG: UDP-N-acetylenolpyruvoylglucosamine reductase [Candidatus Woesebacteria bacterium GW2011_GWB1_38_5b]|uniref:UDP-N-acetylenolpyruvoylglucosamine reductase n=1 Tax=Candidatus Woesebacteria bacterium GW2011_GWB1_38_5b TaxID=1618569 RepID=A0A0G0K9X5_9BACT|nr:MAG: UDP-N-acetylenolpyruvoylglucosamine reductase [Candidatus Woesebacteria bacterium GW2011_GWB1_38_5b]